MLDQHARRRLRELREELEELRGRGDLEGGEKIEAEIDFIERKLIRAVGLGGRDRRAGSAAVRARLSVTRAINESSILMRVRLSGSTIAVAFRALT